MATENQQLTQNKAIIFADGGSRGNPGPAGAGALVQVGGKTVGEISQFIGVATNNVAEYTGLILALEKALELGIKTVEVRMDSELIVKQMNGQYKVKHPGLIPLSLKARTLANKFQQFNITHVRREQNKDADRLANQALDLAAKQI